MMMHIHESATRTILTSMEARTLATAIPYVSWYYAVELLDREILVMRPNLRAPVERYMVSIIHYWLNGKELASLTAILSKGKP